MNAKMGFILIDLTSLPLELGEESFEIEDEVILKQLLELSDIALHSERQLKPVYIRTLDKNGIEVTTLAQLGRNAGTLAILGDINFNRLVILVSYDVDEETSEVSIDSATLLYSEVKSGTKLYLHTLSFQSSYEIRIITNSDDINYRTDTISNFLIDINELIFNSIKIIYISINAGAGILFATSQVSETTIKFTYLDSDDESAQSEIAPFDGSNVVHTITAL